MRSAIIILGARIGADGRCHMVKATVTFPENYKNLCVGIGGETQPRIMRTKCDEDFEGGHFKYAADKARATAWWQTSNFKKANDNFHFMRIR
ncbi:MAG TPA: hypothetical protein DCP91_01965 [Eggerthellaceae bacterium]|nr:hypothetical protein [Eggerthellaceae bacterium]